MIGDQHPNLPFLRRNVWILPNRNFAPELVCLKLGGITWEDIYVYIFVFLLNCWFFSSTIFEDVIVCLSGKLFRLKIVSPKIGNTFWPKKLRPQHVSPQKKWLVSYFECSTLPPFHQQKKHMFTTWTNLRPKNKQFALEKWLEHDS